MSALAINETAAAALVTAWDFCDQVLSPAVLNFRPSNDYDPAAGGTVTTWGASITGKKVLKWEEETGKSSTRDADTQGSQARATVTKILLRTVDIGSEVPAPDMMIEIAGEQWKVSKLRPQVSTAFTILEVRK